MVVLEPQAAVHKTGCALTTRWCVIGRWRSCWTWLTIAPDAYQDDELAHQLVADVSEPGRDVLPDGKVNVEAPRAALVQELLHEEGWGTDEPWTPLRRDLAEPVQDPGVRIEVIGPTRAHVRAAVRAWSPTTSRAMAPDRRTRARCWSPTTAGHRRCSGRRTPGPGCSSAIVCTPSSNVGGVATYESAGFLPLPEVRDRRRDASAE